MGAVQMGGGGELAIGEMSVQSMGEMREELCPNFLQPLLEDIDRKSCNDVKADPLLRRLLAPWSIF